MLKGILAISGQSGLFKLVADSKNSIIVESLESKKRFPVHSTTKVSSLEDISVFTLEGDTPLIKVFKSISDKENGGEALNHKMPDQKLKSYFAEVLPQYDKEKVYMSDIRKILMWYNILHGFNMLDFSELNEEKQESAELPAEGSEQS